MGDVTHRYPSTAMLTAITGQHPAAQGLAPGPEGDDRKAGQGQIGKQ